MGTLKIYSLSNFRVGNTVLVTIVTVLYVTFPRLILLLEVCTFGPPASPLHLCCPPLTPASGDHHSVLYNYELFFFLKIPHISEITWYWSFSAWLISLSKCPWGPSGKISFSFRAESDSIVHVLHLLYPPIHRCTLRLLPYLGHCK